MTIGDVPIVVCVRMGPQDGVVVLLRALRISGGVVLVLAGTAMMVLPGPGVLTIVAGLVMLSSEWSFAKRVLVKIEQRFPWLASRTSR